jgi:hypothetical protein
MKSFALLLMMINMPLTAAIIEALTVSPKAVFGGGRRALDVTFRNATESSVELGVRVQLLQTSSATAVPWSQPRPSVSLALLPRQSKIGQADIDFPSVRTASSFLVRFVSEREVLGVLGVRVYPAGILSNLTASLGPVTVSAVRPGLQRVLLESGFNLEESGLPPSGASWPRLAIHGPEFITNGTAAGVAQALSHAKSGTGVVLILPDDDERVTTAPSYYSVPVGKGTLVTVREGTLADLATDPLAQLRLARIIRLALGQEFLTPPNPDL